jgi:DNA-binding IclR family transcriptional regulator
MQRARAGAMTTDLSRDYLGARVLALESQCKGSHDLIPAARKFAQELRRLHGEGYDVRGVTIRGTVLRNDNMIVPRHKLTLIDGELLER